MFEEDFYVLLKTNETIVKDKRKFKGMLTNIISVGCKPKDTEIAEKINELNGLVKNIIELGKHE